jgi:hypothetical protein
MIDVDTTRISEVLLGDGAWHLVVRGTFEFENAGYRNSSGEVWPGIFTGFMFNEQLPPDSLHGKQAERKWTAGPTSSILAVRWK